MTDMVFAIAGSVVIAAAVLTFAAIQRYLDDPRRKELNELWYAKFEAFVDQRYADGQLRWREMGITAYMREPRI